MISIGLFSGILLAVLGAVALLLLYAVLHYVPIIERNAFNIPRHQVPQNHRSPPAFPPGEIRVPDLEPFTAQYISNGGASRRVVIFCHETGANWQSWSKHASFLPSEGIDVLAFNMDDRPDIYQWPALEDAGRIRAAIEWVSRHKPGAPIVLFGVSKGAGVAAASDHPAVKGFILDGAFSTVLTLAFYIKKWAGIYVGFASMARHIPDPVFRFLSRLAIVYARFTKKRQFFSIEQFASQLRKPVLFVHAEDDPFVRREEVEKIRRAIRASTELWVAPNAGHSESVEAQPEEYRARVLKFLLS